MANKGRREFVQNATSVLGAAFFSSLFPSSIAKALSIPAARRTGTLEDVEHIVILTQENRSFDHYFGTFAGVRGFGDPFPIPRPNDEKILDKSVWYQPSSPDTPNIPVLLPFRLDTEKTFEVLRVQGTPHSWDNAQRSWNHGKLDKWAFYKKNHSMGFFNERDIPFQHALANAFTLCDAYHCSFQGGTNPNRLFIWTGTNDGIAKGNGPATYNEYDWFEGDPGQNGGFNWTTFPERLEKAGISWRIYQDMEDNFTNNPLAGFKNYRDAWFERSGFSKSLKEKAVSTRKLDGLKEDVLKNNLPQVSWIIATTEGSEHPSVSTPAQGAHFTSQVLDALTSNPEVWSKTVFIVNYDENDGFFDHVPPPAPPSNVEVQSNVGNKTLAGASTVDCSWEYHTHLLSYHNNDSERELLNRPYGLGPRVPMFVISPWSRGGFVNSQVFDHTSILQFIEKRFGVSEPNISPWRRAISGDLTSCFNFNTPNDERIVLPETIERSQRASNLQEQMTPIIPENLELPKQNIGIKPSRGLPYELNIKSSVLVGNKIKLVFENTGSVGAVFHVYDCKHLEKYPRRYTVESRKQLDDIWESDEQGNYDLWVLAPNGFHRRYIGNSQEEIISEASELEAHIEYNPSKNSVCFVILNKSVQERKVTLVSEKYNSMNAQYVCEPQKKLCIEKELNENPWYDVIIRCDSLNSFYRRFAGRLETGKHSFSDPAMGTFVKNF